MLLDCFDAASKKISGMHTEIGADDSVWLMPDGKNMPGAMQSCSSLKELRLMMACIG